MISGSDDLTDPQSFNRYTYVQNDPVNFTDPSGLLRVAVLVNCRTNWVWKEHVEGGGDWYDMGEVCELMVIEVGGGEVGSGGGGGTPVPVQGQHNVQSQRPPCEEQDFNFSSGAGGFSAQELSAIAQTAVGEASTAFYPQEVETLIATIVNRLNINRAYAAAGVHRFPFSNNISVMSILESGYEAYQRRSGQAKLDQAKAANGGVLAADSYVCEQLRAAKRFARQVGSIDPDELITRYPYTYNLGIGVPLPFDAFNVLRIGNTRFYMRPLRW